MAEDERGEREEEEEEEEEEECKEAEEKNGGGKERGRKRVQQADTRVGTSDKLAQFWYNRVRSYNTPVTTCTSRYKRIITK